MRVHNSLKCACPFCQRVLEVIRRLRTLEALLKASRREHFHFDEDTWYCCPKCTVCDGHTDDSRRGAECDCEVRTWNVRLDEAGIP